MDLRRVTCHRAMYRPNLLLGCERELILFAGLVAVLLTVVVFDAVAVVVGVLFWIASVWVLQRMAKADPLMSRVYVRYSRLQPFYPARSTPFAQSHRSSR